MAGGCAPSSIERSRRRSRRPFAPSTSTGKTSSRGGDREPLPVGTRKKLDEIITRLGGTPIPSDGIRGTQSASRGTPADTGAPTRSQLRAAEERFVSLHASDPQRRGYKFEGFLNDFFDLWGIDARGGFRDSGEQIDGSFVHGRDVYPLEAKWHREPANAAMLHSFQGKVRERSDWVRGLFVSYSGFSPDAMSAFTARRIILMDGMDVRQALLRSLPLGDVLDAKLRWAAERKEPFAPAAKLFPL